MDLPPEISAHIPALCSLAQRYGLHSVSIVGSVAAGEFDPARSDLDLLVDFGEYTDNLGMRAVHFYLDAQQLFGRRVDVISVNGIRNPRWRAIYEATQVPIYVAA